jgi:hypothetical protein
MDASTQSLFDQIKKEAEELIDTVETALDEHAQFSFMLETRGKVEDVSARYRAAKAKLGENDALQIDRHVGRRVMDLQRMATRLPSAAIGAPAPQRVDTGFFETRPGKSSRQPITIGEGARKEKKLGVTDETEAWCGRCMSLRNHVIAAMVGDLPAQVVCQSCGSRSRFREGPVEKKKEKKTSASAASTKPVAESDAAKEKKALLEQLRNAENVRAYSPKDRYKAGEIIEHPEHGRGKIENILPRSLLVRFASGLKPLKLA